ncbi:hypothetical protein GW915_10510 [bacterium]|nr:hypothetical protein [bacterium]
MIDRATLFLYKKNRPVTLLPRILLIGSIALGISALVTLKNFSKRIEKTVLQDSKKLLTADLRISSRRPFEEKVYSHLLKMGNQSSDIVRQTDFIGSIILPDSTGSTAMLRAVEGNYPFYGELKTSPQLKIEDLSQEASVIVDKSLRAKGFKLGEKIRIGLLDFKISAFIEEEPQALATVFAVGPRIAFHQKYLESTGLTGVGSRAFHYYLVRTAKDFAVFREEFRKGIPEPHVRIRSPERSSNQSQRIIQNLNSFLSLVALCALFLGAIGIFSVYRSQLYQRLPYDLTLRCIGFSKKQILRSYLLLAAESAALGGLLGYCAGAFLESKVADLAQKMFEVTLSEIPFSSSWLFASAITASSVFISMYFPVIEVLKVPVTEAIRSSQNSTPKLSRKEVFSMFAGILLLILFVVSFDWKMATVFLGAIASIALILNYLGQQGASTLHKFKDKFSFSARIALNSLVRSWSKTRYFVISVGLSILVLLSVLMLGYSLRTQIDLSQRIEAPNLFLLGVQEQQREKISELLSNVEFTPVIQARLLSLKGEDIIEDRLEDDQGVEDDDEKRFLTREYTLTKRSRIQKGEKLSKGDTLFAKGNPNVVRVSLEESFSSRVNLNIGDAFKINLAGVPLEARVDSLRKVDWWSFRPNFFIVLNEEDVGGAPFNFVGSARVSQSELPTLQTRLQKGFPELSVIDGESIALKVSTLLDRLSFAILSLGLFSIAACVLVFVGMLLARQREKLSQIALLKSLGARSPVIIKSLAYEYIFMSFIATLVGVAMSLIVVSLVCLFALKIPFAPPPFWSLLVVSFALPTLLSLIAILLARNSLRSTPADVLRSSDS